MSAITRLPRAIIQRALGVFGYRIQARPTADAFTAQKRMLAGRSVNVILDVGAYVGDVALRYHGLFPKATIHCFEPFKDSYIECLRRVGPFASVHNAAIAGETGTATLMTNRAPYTNSLLSVAKGSDAFVDPRLTDQIGDVQVQSFAIDDFCKQQSIERVDVLKLDVQGAELVALKGAKGMLSQAAVELIYLEVNFAPIYDGQATLNDLEGYLGGFSYRLAGIYDPHVATDGSLAWADAIFICSAPVSAQGGAG